MPPSSLGAAAAVLALIVWWLGRRRPAVMLRSTDASAVAALNRAQLEAPLSSGPFSQSPAERSAADPGTGHLEDDLPVPPPGRPPSPLERRSLLGRLHRGLRGDSQARLAAIRAARRWGDQAVLPLLRRGLRDPDPAVMREAALGLERFRGRTPATQVRLAAPPLPRNVSRTL
ncbi:HEAT repeat domain-containing protein [Cyanobium sp. NIES-981]|uniref:HEAT repeat domain-containing protein n=1 Tax=Cyanobium sp. NIES-981 TaxID=1851505 RepID=UPI0007DD2236|nr:HEAT repeat domain-containing protein [Cyanobium sp. NIES-981]SBO43586.1 conserved protein of unknown function [Cyanobium sp. NIES-981]